MTTRTAGGRGLHPVLFTGLAVASVGGPLALSALYVPAAVGEDRSSAGLLALAATAAFAPPVFIWWSYSRSVAGPGGLYSFTEAAAGRPVARAQALLWAVSYLLYLLYTVDDVVHDLLPAAVPGSVAYQPALQVGLSLLVLAVVLAPLVAAAAVLAGLAVIQLALVGVLAAVTAAHTGAPVSALAPHLPARELAVGGGVIALLYVCASLPLFFGGEVMGGGRSVRRGLLVAYGLTGVGVVAAAVPLAAVPALGDEPIPGMTLAAAGGGPLLGTAVGVGVAASTLALVVIEYLALSRLVHAVTARPVRRVARWLIAPFLAANAISLLAPGRFYDALLRPSLVALWAAQLITVAVYPAYVARRRRLRPLDLALTALACAVMLFGLYTTTVGQLAT